MIPFFPTPYPDELWYSVICRYHIRSGNPSVKYSIRELYGANHINVPVELCGALSSLLEAIPAKALTAKDIIMQHTLYPYYTRFFSNNRKKSAYMLALNGNRHAGQHIGIYQSSSMDARRMRYCPQCFDEDIAAYGEPYWHRLHQIPGIAVCPRHGCWLADTEITLTGHRHNLLFPALPDCHLLPTPDTTPTAAQKTFAALMQDALTAPYDFCDGGGYRAIIKRALRNRGYASVTGGRIYAARIAEAVNAFYGGNFESVDSNEIYGVASNSRTVSVRKILQLACFLNLSLSDLLAPPSEDNTLAEIREMYQQGMAEAHGLEVEHHPKYGWTITSPGVDLLDFIEQQGWQDLQMVEGVSLLDVLGTLPKGGSRTKKPSSTRKYICPKCGNSCRATKAINIICGDCMDKMIVAE